MVVHRSTFGLVAAIGLLAMHTANASESPSAQKGHLGWQAYFSGEFGGDKLATVYYTNGQSQNVNTGQGIGLGVGGHYQFANSNFDLSATIGLKYVTTQASNADIHMRRMVTQLMGTYLFKNGAFVAVGPEFHSSIEFAGDGLGPSISFDSATGMTIKAGWRWFGVRYTNMEYQDTTRFKYKYDANSYGFELIGRF